MKCPVPARGPLLCLALLSPAVAHASNVLIEIDPASIASPAPDSTPPEVQVSDIRDSTALERTTIGQVSLGQIEIVPTPPELVGAIVAATASGIEFQVPPEGAPPVVYCGLRRFSIETPATLLYWDIEARIDVVLRVGDQDREVAASARARTWVYPGKQLLENVLREALVKLADGLGPALAELAAAPPPEDAEATAEAETAPSP